ncbi:MAG: CorA family divalent cation transporter [Eubacteriales bacterium]|nr:CorA family divalent cation transporter [Eubacteriales bacterium]
MSIGVYILKTSIVKSSVDEYLQMKENIKEKKRLQRQQARQEGTPLNIEELKRKKDIRTVFVSGSDTAEEALMLAGISYEGDVKLEDIEFCKVEAQQKCLCGTLHIPKLGDPLGDKIMMYFFLNRKNIVIIDDHGFGEKIIRRIISSRTKPGQSREKFLYNFCVKFMDQDLDYLGRYGQRIMQIEEDINNDEIEDVMEEIAQIRKELLILREYYDELRDFGKQLEENENRFFSGKNLEYFGIISDRADRLMGRTMYLLDYIGQVRETYQGKVAEQQNKNMEFLTIISTIFFPLTLITGWYGMNFNNMPELANGYPGVIILSLCVIGIIILIFKKRKIL